MPLKLWQTGLEHGLGRIIRESLLEQLTGQREELEAFELNSREQEPIAPPSIKEPISMSVNQESFSSV